MISTRTFVIALLQFLFAMSVLVLGFIIGPALAEVVEETYAIPGIDVLIWVIYGILAIAISGNAILTVFDAIDDDGDYHDSKDEDPMDVKEKPYIPMQVEPVFSKV